jgi:hypothetical protein
MKKLIIVSVIMALILLAGGSFTTANAQDLTKEEKPTFYRLIPGVYVNPWPRFTVTYPKDWVEKVVGLFSEYFRAEAPPSSPRSALSVNVFSNPLPIEKLGDIVAPFFKANAQDVTVVSDKPTRLRDGTLARELETKMVMNGEPLNILNVATKKGDIWVNTGTRSYSGKIEEYQRAMLYSLQYEPIKDETVKVPPDIQAFLDKYCSDFVSHDLAKVMSHYSDRYLNSGTRKGEMERFFRQMIGSWMSHKMTITDFVPAGDRAYFAGFVIGNFGTFPMIGTSIIKESGEWKWYGNQRDARSR